MAIIIYIDVMLAKRKMSVTELAEKVGITMANISMLKNGKAKAVRLSTLEAICNSVGMPAWRYFGIQAIRRGKITAATLDAEIENFAAHGNWVRISPPAYCHPPSPVSSPRDNSAARREA
jgi:putative transcriptional regulator